MVVADYENLFGQRAVIQYMIVLNYAVNQNAFCGVEEQFTTLRQNSKFISYFCLPEWIDLEIYWYWFETAKGVLVVQLDLIQIRKYDGQIGLIANKGLEGVSWGDVDGLEYKEFFVYDVDSF